MKGDPRWTDVVVAVGTARTGLPNMRGAPRQGSLAPALAGRVELDVRMVAGDALEGLEGFSHAWVVFAFSRNTNGAVVGRWREGEATHFPAKVKPPRFGGRKLGVFATRTPHRPNALGLSLVRVVSVDAKNGVLVVAGSDLCDATPVLDVKPFVPADVPGEDPTFPAWTTQSDSWTVEFAPQSLEAIEACFASGVAKMHGSARELRLALEQVISLDVRGVSQRRGASEADTEHRVVVDGVRARFRFRDDNVCFVEAVERATDVRFAP